MGERLLCKQEVIGSIPFTSTIGVESGLELALALPGLPLKRRRVEADRNYRGRVTVLPQGAIRWPQGGSGP